MIRFRAERTRRHRSAPPPSGTLSATAAACDTGALLVARDLRGAVLRGNGVDDVIGALADLHLARVPLDCVQTHVAHHPGVLDGEVARDLVRIGVEVLVPGPNRR